MREYQLYLMDRLSGHIEHLHDFHVRDDSDAIRIAGVWRNEQPMELWEYGRKVERWTQHDGPSNASSGSETGRR